MNNLKYFSAPYFFFSLFYLPTPPHLPFSFVSFPPSFLLPPFLPFSFSFIQLTRTHSVFVMFQHCSNHFTNISSFIFLNTQCDKHYYYFPLKLRELRCELVREVAQDHTDHEQKIQDLNVSALHPETVLITTTISCSWSS